jgi:hypothetical protein
MIRVIYGALIVGILSPTNRSGLGAGICISIPNGDKTFYVFHIYSTENVFRKNHKKHIINNKSAHSIHNLTLIVGHSFVCKHQNLFVSQYPILLL